MVPEMKGELEMRNRMCSVLLAAILLLSTGCGVGVKGLQRVIQIQPEKRFESVQVVVNSYGSPDCNDDYCFVLFTDGKAKLHMPFSEDRGPGSPGEYNLSSLWAYQASDGSLVFGPPGTHQTEYQDSSGNIVIQSNAGRSMGNELNY